MPTGTKSAAAGDAERGSSAGSHARAHFQSARPARFAATPAASAGRRTPSPARTRGAIAQVASVERPSVAAAVQLHVAQNAYDAARSHAGPSRAGARWYPAATARTKPAKARESTCTVGSAGGARGGAGRERRLARRIRPERPRGEPLAEPRAQ